MHRSLLVTVLSCWVLAGCRGQAVEASAAQPPGEASALRDESIYALSMTLRDQDGNTVGLDVFRGKPVLLGMFYGSCPSACPLLVSTVKRVMSGLEGTDTRVLLVSFDAEKDTPQALHRIAEERGLDARWRLASGPEDQVRELAALLGVQYRRHPDGSFSHTSSIVLLDRAGAIGARLDDMAQPVDRLIRAAASL